MNGDTIALIIWAAIFLFVLFKVFQTICLVPTKSAYIVEFFGKYNRTLEAGFHILIPFVERVVDILDLKEETINVPPQECFSRDEVKVQVDGVIYISVQDPTKACYGITDYRFAAVQLAQTTTRSVIGTLDLDKTFEERDLISAKVVEVLDQVGHSWGIRVHRYEIKNIAPPETVKNAMEKQVGSERERRAILARSEGDKQSRINKSLGLRAELINRSEGEMQRRINEAEGRAAEIVAIAKATAISIEQIAHVVSAPGGKQALSLKLGEQYINALEGLENSQIIIPANLAQFSQWLDNIKLDNIEPEPTPTPPSVNS